MDRKPSRPFLALMLALVAVPQAALAAPARAPAHIRVDQAYLVGAWTDDGDCADAVRFISDGRFVLADGGGGNWSLSGDRLTMTGSKVVAVRIVPIDRDRIRILHADGSRGSSTRCAAPAPEDAPPASDVT
jgi:hypothetical protein